MDEDFILKDIPPHLYFWTKGGIAIRSLSELLSILEQMDNETFEHHVNNEKNDFSDWIKNVFHEKKLASEVGDTTSKDEIIKIIRARATKPAEPILEEIKESIEITEDKVKDILLKEREIAKKEEKIQEIEERLEKKLESAKTQKGVHKDAKFFSKEFVQGIIVGLLLSLIGVVVYIKFFA